MRPDSSGPRPVIAGWRVPRLAIAAILLLVTHVVVLALFRHSPSVSVQSDFLQLAMALFTAAVCFLTSRRSSGIARPFWHLTGMAFALWSLGMSFLIYDSYHLGITTIRIVPLLLFFLSVAPMFVTVFLSEGTFGERIDPEWVLDAVQILVLVVIIYIFVVYIPMLLHGEEAVRSLEDRLLLWRNALLASGLLARAFLAPSPSIRRLYLPVGISMAVFAVSTWIGNRAQSLNVAASAMYDLAWSIPFCMIALAAIFWQELPEQERQPQVPDISRVILAYLPSLILPVMLLVNYREVVREQIFLGLFGLMFSIVLFNARLALTQRRQRLAMEALNTTEHQY